MNKSYLYTVIGVAAFIVGGIVTREKALDMAETVEKFFEKNKTEEPATPPAE